MEILDREYPGVLNDVYQRANGTKFLIDNLKSVDRKIMVKPVGSSVMTLFCDIEDAQPTISVETYGDRWTLTKTGLTLYQMPARMIATIKRKVGSTLARAGVLKGNEFDKYTYDAVEDDDGVKLIMPELAKIVGHLGEQGLVALA